MPDRPSATPYLGPPRASNPQFVEVGWARWRDATAKGEETARRAAALAADARWRDRLGAIFGSSPFLTEAALAEAECVLDVAGLGPDAAAARLFDALDRVLAENPDRAGLDRALRRAKRRVALTVGLADLAGLWPLETVTGTLSAFARRATDAALWWHYSAGARLGWWAPPPAGGDLAGSGVFILGMGKLGADELNYSSDIDLIALYDPEAIDTAEPERLRERMIRVTQDVVATLSQRTADGYVFRTDLRLRPDPGSTPIAISVRAAETYYESFGQNWERAAMIKARPVAGDILAGAAFLRTLRPFIWRRNLDFAAIQDIHSIKRQINAHRGGSAVAVLGHDVKLGRGGIREVEFFCQTQQLIYGGRNPALRGRGTLATLEALAAAGHVSAETARALADAYRYLRAVEHRLQMVDDQQTQKLPADPAALDGFARFAGYEDGRAFSAALLHHLGTVEDRYARLFEDAPSLSGPGNLVFTGADHDPATLETLAALGYREPKTVSALIRGWHHGRYRAMRSARAREVLTELVPAIAAALAKSAAPDEAFKRFDDFLARLPTGVQLFSLLAARPELLELIGEIMGSAPRLAAHLARRPELIDPMTTAAFYEPLPARAELERSLADALAEAALAETDRLEDALDAARRWAHDRQFQVGTQLLRGLVDAAEAGAALSDIADACIACLLPRIEADFAQAHGRVPGGAVAILALGKLGGRELSASSDLDLVFVYDAAPGAEQSDGKRPLAIGHYYARLAPRFVNALAAQTAAGSLYAVDMRLRPAGDKGPLATSFEAFLRYQERDAWTWEHMALTRARFVAGDAALGERVMNAVRATLTSPRDPDRLLADVASMRRRIAQQHKGAPPWQVKHMPGGLVDVEFIAQYLQLRDARRVPAVLSPNTADALTRLAAAGLISAVDAGTLVGVVRLYQDVQALLRLTVGDAFDDAAATDGLKRALARAASEADFPAVAARLNIAAIEVRSLYARIIERPASRLVPAPG
jgi:[glutamine synthetase] adenylyltransferase / [glutamine synthetase]-adenylyl-L-tyrosine phosphorylase